MNTTVSADLTEPWKNFDILLKVCHFDKKKIFHYISIVLQKIHDKKQKKIKNIIFRIFFFFLEIAYICMKRRDLRTEIIQTF